MKVLSIAAALWMALAASALASQPVALKPQIGMQNGRVTLGDLFDGAGAAAGVVVASGATPGANLVLDAGRVQMLARAHGLDWTNERGVRRIIARADIMGSAAPLAVSGAPARPARQRAAPGPWPMRATSPPARSFAPRTWSGPRRAWGFRSTRRTMRTR